MRTVGTSPLPVVEIMAAALTSHASVRRANGMAGSTCSNPLCREPVFLTSRDAQNHQTAKILQRLGIDASDEERAFAELAALIVPGPP